MCIDGSTCESLGSEVHERSSIEDEILSTNVNLYVALDYQNEVAGGLATFIQSTLAVRVWESEADDDVLF